MPGDPGTAQSGPTELKTLTSSLEGTLKSCVRELHLAIDPKADGALPVLAHWTALRASLDQLSGAIPEVVNVVAALQRNAERQFDEVETEFRARCSARGWAINGQWPDFYVEYGIPVAFSKETRTATVSGRRTTADASSVMNALESLVQELIPTKFNEKVFLNSMGVAYDGATTAGGQTPLLDVYKSMVIQSQTAKFWRDARTGGFKGISLDQFRARLTRCLLTGRQQDARERFLRLFPALNPADAVFLFQPAEQRFGWVGRIEFVHE